MAMGFGMRRRGWGLVLALLVAAAAGSGGRAAKAASEESLAGQPAPAAALASPWVETEQTRLRLLSAAAGVGEAAALRLGLEFKLASGWKIYWRSPGAAGFPPHLDWTGSENLAHAAMAWPAPKRFSVLGLDTLGYHDEVVFPLTATPVKPGEALKLALKVDYLVCSEICVPYTANLALTVPAGPADATAFTQLIDRYAARVPDDGAAAGLAIAGTRVGGSRAHPVLEVEATAREPFSHPDIFVEGPSELDFAAPRVALSDGGHHALLRLAIGTVGKAFPDWSATPLTLTLVDGARALEAHVTPRAAPQAPEWQGLLAMLGLALLGGLILNLMPCVLPVLSLKLLGIVGHGGAERRAIRVSFLASAAGVLAVFLALASAAVAAKAAGQAVGWGMQFQEPAFLTALAAVAMLFAANLWGLFEIRLPGFLADALAGGSHGRGIFGEFLTGAFATVLATPCSAPFVGTALSFALARGPLEIFAIFAALGTGLALPYLTVAAMPGLAGRLPRPGRWMVVLRAVLGAALAATAAWLLFVLAGERGMRAALLVAALLAAVPPALAARRRWPVYFARSGAVAVVALILAAFLLPDELALAPAATTAAASEGDWRPLARAQIPRLVAEGKTVFVDVTADWCLSCKANKAFVLDRQPVQGLLAAPDVVRMVADWTRPSDEIAAYLASFGRYGIPFNVVYGPGAPAGIALPELLNADAVRAALLKAGRANAAGTGASPAG
ncbi:MAG TPA: protein-disulfide reductase DsbD domain-containing protein [Alphaproteobacteria bacterium]|nr:protein-disulfide reductase DsbD domain-containing protein [Alphaproteobacteria bacterium]